ncbi:DUF3309 domain-containing protein [Paraburkholderia sp. Ac-20336]|nr:MULTISPECIES: DUF3309 family protein [Burkholderiaceae]MBN3804017.1 DUF3309 domain-containing protein [Paraburkholderia sp. Ac-20336]MBN3847630.1 DUF3309 domain-containing protein [Paraburkholderia sp. Ac-20342]NIF53373.1 DUF3309 domain-containing protein [Burkholderia sp. Ax-1724]
MFFCVRRAPLRPHSRSWGDGPTGGVGRVPIVAIVRPIADVR